MVRRHSIGDDRLAIVLSGALAVAVASDWQLSLARGGKQDGPAAVSTDAEAGLDESSPESVEAELSAALDLDGDSRSVSDSVPALSVNSMKLQPAPPALPRVEAIPITATPSAATSLFGSIGVDPAGMGARRQTLAGNLGSGYVTGVESRTRAATDTGSLLGKSPSALGVEMQRRTPIVNDPRTRGSRVGSLAASGSHWVPARIDLDTAVSKLDSRIIEDVIVVPGPFSVRHGPSFQSIDVQLLRSPRYEEGAEWHGSTSLDYKTNGEQWYGRQSIWGGDETWGVRAGYGHRTGDDYASGAGIEMPSQYHSRDFDAAIGWDPTEFDHVEFRYLRLDQTDVLFPGQAFDIDFLTTDGFEVEYEQTDQDYYDRLSIESWYNRTRFAGSAQRPEKRRQFPLFDRFFYVGFTDVDSMSAGFSGAVTWGEEDDARVTLGADLRHVEQELNEIGTGFDVNFNFFDQANSPIPRSFSSDPGVFFDFTQPLGDTIELTYGVRIDAVSANIIDEPAKLVRLGNNSPANQASLAEILGSDEYDQNFSLWSTYLSGVQRLNDSWSVVGGLGYAERPPNLTELYAAEPFMFLLQNGLNNVTGDPRLDPERLHQVELGLNCRAERVRGGIRGYYGWVRDYITFENLRVFSTATGQQVSLKYVNTELATLSGFELHGEWDALEWCSPFGTLQYVQGTDRTRTGEFDTTSGAAGLASFRTPGVPRGTGSGAPLPEQEPLPSISPMEARIGLRLHPANDRQLWNVEFSARIMDDQDRIAASLLETATAGFTTLDLRGYWRIRPPLLLVVGVENLGDRNYREHLDYRSPEGASVLQPGISFYGGAELTY